MQLKSTITSPQEESVQIFLSALTVLLVAKAAWRTKFELSPEKAEPITWALTTCPAPTARLKIPAWEEKCECPLAVINIISWLAPFQTLNLLALLFSAVCDKAKQTVVFSFSVYICFSLVVWHFCDFMHKADTWHHVCCWLEYCEMSLVRLSKCKQTLVIPDRLLIKVGWRKGTKSFSGLLNEEKIDMQCLWSVSENLKISRTNLPCEKQSMDAVWVVFRKMGKGMKWGGKEGMDTAERCLQIHWMLKVMPEKNWQHISILKKNWETFLMKSWEHASSLVFLIFGLSDKKMYLASLGNIKHKYLLDGARVLHGERQSNWEREGDNGAIVAAYDCGFQPSVTQLSLTYHWLCVREFTYSHYHSHYHLFHHNLNIKKQWKQVEVICFFFLEREKD